ncbi:TcpE family conjugal transfer membrane protein (plasmid) [Niallia sp. XMNu-256]|uniref:TcpE family conjugal transfer membrane protein n=1 Tax=Niallia sp. XMNu-256 TaxID=3082444 RepID=UPI0030D54B59
MKPKILRTYNSVWKVEKVLYGIQDIPLPFPLTYRQIGFFSGGVFIVWILNQFPPLSLLNLSLVEYVFLPGLFTWFFTKQLLDGKAAHRFFIRVIQYHLSPHLRNRYKEVSDRKKPYQYGSNVGYRQLSYNKGGRTDD